MRSSGIVDKSDFKQRLDYAKASPGAVNAMRGLQRYVEQQTDLPRKLLELVRMRASQLNGCAFCLDMHSQDARAAGETDQRLYVLDAWREAPFYSDMERAALAWTEAVTLVSESRVPSDVYREAREYFNEKQLVDLTLAVIAINGWNRLSISFRHEAGTCHRPRTPTMAP